ncbi:MAG: hypothetical protein OHK0029_12850 [Armatimonadaceae bacterium]
MTQKLRSAAGRIILSGGLTALALLFMGSSAQAQVLDPVLLPDFAFRVGTYIPTDDDVRRAGGTHNLALEFDYIPQRFSQDNAYSVVSIGYIERDGFKLIPLTIAYIKRENSEYLRRPYYYGIGGGLYQTRVRAVDTSGENKWIPGGFVVAGVDLSPRLFGEIKYHYISRYDGKFVGGTQISAGIRF